MNSAIFVENLTKVYAAQKQQIIALDNISFSINKGDFVIVIGPDGAGKTTLIKILSGIINFEKGKVEILGNKLPQQHNKIKRNIGYLSQHFSLYGNLTVEENLKYFAGLFLIEKSKEKIESLLKISDLSMFRHRLAKHLSGGMKQKLSVICSLIHSPEILFLDEPTTGIDPISRRELFKIIEEKVDEGLTIFMTTAYMDEAERAKKIIFLNKGKIIEYGSYEEIFNKADCKCINIFTERPLITINLLKNIPGIKFINPIGKTIQILTEKSFLKETLEELIKEKDISISEGKLSMELLFINNVIA